MVDENLREHAILAFSALVLTTVCEIGTRRTTNYSERLRLAGIVKRFLQNLLAGYRKDRRSVFNYVLVFLAKQCRHSVFVRIRKSRVILIPPNHLKTVAEEAKI